MTKNRYQPWFLLIYIIAILSVCSYFPQAVAAEAAKPAQFKIGSSYYGFELVDEKPVADVNSIVRLFKHTKSGAQLLYLENNDNNKVFSITFRTPPSDSTGIPHIIEHSVLAGSRKFHTKEPFLDLQKSSLCTYLNAATYPDKTMFPVASQNEKDLFNLMDVYLDAVFYPNFYNNPGIFKQEGWHYELNTKNDPVTYKGVVYNEMKGSFSDPMSVLGRKINETLFPDTPYRHVSGGNPEFMPNLTEQQFLDFHRKYYHPSNSYIYLYGNMNIMAALQFLNDEYLSAFDKKDINSAIPLQTAFTAQREAATEYPLPAGDAADSKTLLSMSFVIDKTTNLDLVIAFNSLTDLLLGTPDAPLKKALIDAGIGKEVSGSFESGILQPVFTIVAKDAEESQRAQFEKVIRDTLEKLSHGIDKKLIRATFNRYEFNRREAVISRTDKGLLYNESCLEGWLYGQNPIQRLLYSVDIKQKALKSNYFEKLIVEQLLGNKHAAVVVARPKPGLEDENQAQLKEKLANYKKSLTNKDILQLIDQTKKLKEWQAKPDSPQDQATIPALSINDINPKANRLELKEKNVDGVKVLLHPEFTNGITYVDLYFDTSAVPQDKLPYLMLLSNFLGLVDTEKHNHIDLMNAVKADTGGVGISAFCYTKFDNDQLYYPKMQVSAKAQTKKLSDLLNILHEIIAKSKFDDKKRIKELLEKSNSELVSGFMDGGFAQYIAQTRAQSYISPSEKYNEQLALSYARFIADLLKNYDQKAAEIRQNLEDVAKLAINKDNLVVGITAFDEEYPAVERQLQTFFKKLEGRKLSQTSYNFAPEAKNEGIATTNKVQYIAKAFNYQRLGYTYSGKMRVLQTILNNDYLWNKVRVQGGAYGAGISIAPNGNIVFLSWRDPNLKDTLEIFDTTASYLQNFTADEREMNNYIIATIRSFDAPRNPEQKGGIAIGRYLQGKTEEIVQKEREEILSTTVDDIRSFAAMFSALKQQNALCVVGNDQVLKENRDLFKSILKTAE